MIETEKKTFQQKNRAFICSTYLKLMEWTMNTLHYQLIHMKIEFRVNKRKIQHKDNTESNQRRSSNRI